MEVCHRVCGVARALQGSNQNNFLSSKRVVIIRETPNESGRGSGGVTCVQCGQGPRAPQGSNQNNFLSSKRVVIIRETPNERRWARKGEREESATIRLQ